MVLLETKRLKKYFYDIRAVDGVDLQVREGELLGLIGPNGSGKSTLFDCITGIQRPTAGQILFRGRSLVGLTPDQIARRGIGRTFQVIQLFPEMSVLESMLLAAQEFEGTLLSRLFSRREEEAYERARFLLTMLGLWRMREEQAGNLSYGQQKLLDFGMALMANPSLVLLDEPASGVNPTILNTMLDHIRALNAQGLTFVVIEHNMDFIMRLCQRIVVLHHGQVLAAGPPQAIQSDTTVMQAYFGG
ncbi:MAG: ABC transporter ATP-binding protein [Nitrospinota bacterium]|nr:MAG: ABC transporter ATP-binding protein [Nitrospinota bacterium]